ncbi:MAG: phosphate signaling complex protein PhoU, partial [Pleurocapsa sp. SU_196_0]|nr:phosphate signaling complex protein PhoU [Pleurocapsa sp. SU_196_0]
MREALERDLRILSADFIRMISQVGEQVNLAGQVLLENQLEHVPEVHAMDKRVDDLELKLENECLRVIALHQPVATDLRFVAAILKSLSDLERVGDYAVHVADDARILSSEPPLKRYINLGQMIATAKTMLETTARAFTERDATAALEAARMDQKIDDLYEQTQRELVTYMLEDPRTITKALALLRVGRDHRTV